MKRMLLVSAAGLAVCLPLGEAQAQVMYNQPGGSYGGGFIEMLMTGREPPAGMRALRAYPGPGRNPVAEPFASTPETPAVSRRYAARPADPVETIARASDPVYRKQVVAYDGRERAGTIVVDTLAKFLYLVLGDGQAMRYGIGVGRPGFSWAGVKTVSAKREWPGWTPPPEMLKRRPDLPRHMEGGPANPLGARALYLGSSLYRIHGTNEPDTIGRNVSSGCIRMMNDDVVDLYGRVPVGTKVVVI